MKPIIYIDVLILENFFINYMILYGVKRFCRIKSKYINSFIGALFGAAYVMISFYPKLHIFYSLLMKISISIIMIIVSFYPDDFKKMIKYLLIFYIETFMLGGTILGMFFITNTNIKVYNGVAIFSCVNINYIIIGCICGTALIKLSFDLFDKYNFYKDVCVEIDIVLNNKKCRISGFIDTGNSLKDPFTNKSIIIVSAEAIKCILPQELNSIISENKSSSDILIIMENSEYRARLRLIPYNAVGTQNGILLGLQIDTLTVYIKSKICNISNPVIALYNKPFNKNGNYQALLYPEIVNS